MLCPRCGHPMYAEANFCGRCGTPLRPSVVPPLDVGEPEEDPILTAPDSWQAGSGTPGASLAEPAGQPAASVPLAFEQRDPLAVDPVGVLLPSDTATLLRRPAIAAGPPVTALPVPEPLSPFESALPSMTLVVADAGDAATPESPAAEAAGQGAMPLGVLTAPETDDEGGPAHLGTLTVAPAIAAAARVARASGPLRVAGCTLLIHAGPAPLVEIDLEAGALLTLAAGALVWACDGMPLDGLVPASVMGSNPEQWAYLQAVGPGGLAIAGGSLDTVTPLELAAGTVIEVAATALLAWTRGIRAWRPGREERLRLLASRPALALIGCSGSPHSVDLPAGGVLTVAPDALLAATGAVDRAVLRRYDRTGQPWIEHRLHGPGRVLLGAPLFGVRA